MSPLPTPGLSESDTPLAAIPSDIVNTPKPDEKAIIISLRFPASTTGWGGAGKRLNG